MSQWREKLKGSLSLPEWLDQLSRGDSAESARKLNEYVRLLAFEAVHPGVTPTRRALARDAEFTRELEERPRHLNLSLPIEVHFRPTYGRYAPLIKGRPARFLSGKENRATCYGDNDWQPEVNPWMLRQEFITTDCCGLDAMVWVYGQFGTHGYDLRADEDEWEPLAGQNDFAEWQQLFKEALTLPQSSWESLAGKYPPYKLELLSKPFPLSIEWRNGTPVGTVHLRRVLDAIAFTIQYDQLHGHRFQNCARLDCGQTFRIESNHPRIYCSERCAHLMAVRKSRAKIKTSKVKASRATKQGLSNRNRAEKRK